MKIARFMYQDQLRYGSVEDDGVSLIAGNIFDKYQVTSHKIPLDEVKLLAPCEPSKVVCVGLNYRDHAREMNEPLPEEPVLFIKPSSAVIGPKDDIIYPAMSRQVDYEAELAVIIGQETKNIRAEEAKDYILGYTCANDVTARDLQKIDGQWTRAKSFDTFLPLGPYITTGIDPDNLKIELFLNGNCRQSSCTSELIFNCAALVSFISQVMTLYPGDVVITGTPSGIGPMVAGDSVKVAIEKLGIIENKVVRDPYYQERT